MFVRQFMERIGADTLHFLHYYDRMAQLQAFLLALPLGELSPKVTERALQSSFPSPSSLHSTTSPRGVLTLNYIYARTGTVDYPAVPLTV